MHSFTTTLLVLTVVFVLLPSDAYAFGAGDIPDFAYLNGKAFRHGDIENILAELAKSVGQAGAGLGGGGLLGIAQSVFNAATSGGEGSKFTKEDIKRVYFGNWLRDYSQAMDIAGLSKLSADTLVLIVSVLGFLTFGFATEEFQVTPDRLGVYLPVEHIDNPKGYAEKEGDARQFHPKLRPPVNPKELEIDERTGMKNYMASENRGWDTSTALIRRTFRACIEYGRRSRGREGADLWEAYRLMGTGLHTMEDLLAHSNWCELALRKMGYEDVFCHVGDNVLIDTPNGRTYPLVTGTFGSADFLHSLMGEATDHLSQASVVDLSKKMDEASNGNNDTFGNLQAIIKKLPIGGSDNDKMGEADDMQAKSKAYNFDPNNVAPPEVREQMWQLLKWRDDIYRDIIKKIEMIPGLSDLIDNLTNALNAFVYTVLAPYVAPILKQVTGVLSEGSKAVIDTDDQYQVFDDPDASDPSHSLLSKDHFALILNEPAGKIALVVVQTSVKLLVQAWSDNNDPNRVIDQILEAFHHPWYATGRSRIQQEMFQELENWVNSLENKEETLQALTKDSVRDGKNKREGSDDDMAGSDQVYGGRVAQSSGGNQYGSASNYGAGGYGSSQQQRYGESTESYGSSTPSYGGGYGESRQESYGRSENQYGSSGNRNNEYRQEEPSYGRESGYAREEPSYGRNQESSYERREQRSYGGSESYGGGYEASRQEESYGSSGGYGGRREEQSSRGGYGGDGGYGGRREEQSYTEGYGGRREEQSYTEGYGGRREEESYGGGRREEESYGSRPSYGEEERPRRHHGGGYGGEQREEYGGEQGGYRSNNYEAPRQEGYGGDSYQREERSGYGRQEENFGEGYQPSYSRSGGNEGQSEYGNRREEGYGSGGYGGERGGYGGEGGYGQQERGYGDSGETFGVEGLSMGEDGEGRHRHGHHGRRHQEDY